MGTPSDTAPPSEAPEPSGAPPPLTEGIVRVKVPPSRIEPFLARTALFGKCGKEVIVAVAAQIQGLECAEGSEVVSQGRVNGGLGILFSGRASVFLPSNGGQLLTIEEIGPGDHFGEIGALLGKPSPFFVIAGESSRVLWLPSAQARSLLASVQGFAEAVSKRLAERLAILSTVPHPSGVEVMTEIEAQIVEASEPPQAVRSIPAAEPAPSAGGIQFAEIRDFELSSAVLSMVPTKLIRQYRLLPVKLTGNVLTIGMVNPRDTGALAELKRTLQTVDLAVVAVGLEDFNSALIRLKLTDDVRAQRGARSPNAVDPNAFQFEVVAEQEREARGDARTVGDDVIKVVNRIIAGGLEREASDIHIEPTATGPRIRYRINGVLSDWGEQLPPSITIKTLTARIKVLAGLDITERRTPQDGRIGLNTGRREVDLRVSTLPANRGEKIALRILEAAGSTRPLENIFLDPATLQGIRKALNRPYGGIIVGGPTGSGKTSSLYSILNERKVTRPDTNILMVEDPIEYRLPGVVQTQVNPVAGLTFANVLRAMLRQDPDVIVVGETRDQETAQLALEAAMTGHLLLTSLHANNAIAALQRLDNLGCGRALIAQGVHLILVQRLVRKLCSACRKLDAVTPALLESLVARRVVSPGETMLARPVGCDVCAQSGYVGRAVVAESLQMTDQIREALASGRSLAEVQQLAVQSRSLITFADYARQLLQRQIISAAEVLITLAD